MYENPFILMETGGIGRNDRLAANPIFGSEEATEML